MTTQSAIRRLLDIYYEGFADKSGWESVIADDFRYVGGDMTNNEPIIGKKAYIEVINRFSQVFTAMRVKEMIIEDEKACVIGNYDLKFPNGKAENGNVAELWTAKNGKLQSLTIFFDTLTFANNSKR
jgi:ketosteroid isomerase-like protein